MKNIKKIINNKAIIILFIGLLLSFILTMGETVQCEKANIPDNTNIRFNGEDIINIRLKEVDIINENIKILKSPESSHTEKWKAKETLVQIGKDSVIPLIEVLDDQAARYYGIRALGSLSDKRAVKKLSELLSDRSFSQRRYCAIALGQIGDDSATPALKEALSDVDYVREDVINALIKINTQDSQRVLEEYFFQSKEDDGLEVKIKADANKYKAGDRILISMSFKNISENPFYLLYPQKFFCQSFAIRSFGDGRFVSHVKLNENIRYSINKENFRILNPGDIFETTVEGNVIIWEKGELLDHMYIAAEPFLSIQFKNVAHHIKEPGIYEMRLMFQHGEDEKKAAERFYIEEIWQGKEVSNPIRIEIIKKNKIVEKIGGV